MLISLNPYRACMPQVCVAGAGASVHKETIMLRGCMRTQRCKLLWPRNFLEHLKSNWNRWLHSCQFIF